MKKLFLFSLLLTFGILSQAQVAKKKPVAKPANSTLVARPAGLGTLNDSASYAMGISLASFYKQQGITKINTALVSKAINDVINGKPLQLDEQTANNVMNKCISEVQESKSRPNIAAGEAFLKTNQARAGVKTTATGLQYEVMREGTGEKPQAGDSVTVNYKGALIDGTEFESSYTRGAPITFRLDQVIPGWTEGLQLMSIGSKYKFFVPYTLGYGPIENGPIPGGSALVFEVEMLEVMKVK
ncbi:MAG TPA: FKBP-type peptidyl-prolyl cis-trans isomerase [Chitinophagaceae bacterium]|nr:FKBP-type peptidyl-prolyl cis-trans isomerase [Chitinophagaceae bacterium]